jgi:hypothetical protein
MNKSELDNVLPQHDTGGTAFPAQPIYRMPDGTELATNQGGMTLRDYFAAKAMAALIAEPPGTIASRHCGKSDDELTQFATVAYKMADAMIAARGEV